MVFREEKGSITDQAWERLYQRLGRDGLLPEENISEYMFWQTASFRRVAVVAVLLAGIFAGLFLMRRTDASDKAYLVLHNEANAPVLATMLEDGSVVYLSGQTSLRYPDRFADDKREVILQGEAFFEVSKQAERPFFIDTDLATIEVVGTAFNVKSSDRSSLLLSVRNGAVRVKLKERQQTVAVKAGEAVLFDSERFELIKTSAHPSDAYLNRIHFKDERLGNVARIINMNSDSVRLEVSPELENRLLTVTLSGNRPSVMAEFICLALNLQYTQEGKTVYISQKE
ncbi:MAG: FecR domain-containing protein [Tannerella sp.]|jgi:ferric-dicitrate binding protein FerR (iron transport regulator)|nr:FecR domain-containing protein [Tannerella sp.]